MNDFLQKTITKGSSNQTIVDTCLILQYHRLGRPCYDPLQWTVEPYNFESQMEYLASNCNVISINEMREHIETGTPFRQRTVAVTFDGGYADILYTGKEMLDTHQIFATVFSASTNIIKSGQFWWDTLEDCFIANSFQGLLEIEIDGQILKWPLEAQFDRFKAYCDLFAILVNNAASEQKEILDQITQSIDLQAEETDKHRTMDAQELKELAESDLITIGGHTHSGVRLSSLTKEQQVEEVSKNKEVLEEVLGHDIEYFSYPFGNDDSYACTTTIDILKDNGFNLACGNAYGMVGLTEETNHYDLPRVKVGNWNLYTFHNFLESFLR